MKLNHMFLKNNSSSSTDQFISSSTNKSLQVKNITDENYDNPAVSTAFVVSAKNDDVSLNQKKITG